MKTEPSEAQALSLRTLAARLGASLVVEPGEAGLAEVVVSSLTEDSRKARPGTLFVARVGERTDGVAYVGAAFERGAVAVLCEKGAGVTATPRLEVKDVRAAWGLSAQELYGSPSLGLAVVGITGTNGKTTVSSLVSQALGHVGWKVGRLGTLGFYLGEEKLEDSLTTPQPDQLAENLVRAKSQGARAMILEVSSHALDQQRVAGVHFEVAAFTNLTQDHLDYHATMAEYGAAKARLFREASPKSRVLNIDDPFGASLSREFKDALTVSTKDPRASLFASDVRIDRQGIFAQVQYSESQFALSSGLLGAHNLENLLVAWGILLALGVSPELISESLGKASGVPGRLERCDGPLDDVVVVVDYAHTPDALERVLVALTELQFASVVCVFGCGGDRDKTKRAPMGAAAKRYAQSIYLTSDNPRTEDPSAIINDVLPGLAGAAAPPVVEPDRRTAIMSAILSAPSGSVVLVAGKGHEDYQLVGDQVLAFDDREEARSALLARRNAAL